MPNLWRRKELRLCARRPGACRAGWVFGAVARWGSLGLVMLAVGCTQPRNCVEPRDEWEALARVNENLSKIEQPLQYQASASFSFRDNNGRERRFLGHEAKLTFYNPRDLLFDIRSLAGVIAQFGSNDERYWVWIEPEVRKLWWGAWAALDRDGPRKLPLPPDDLLDALMLRPLPEALAGDLHVMLRKDGQDQRLLFIRLDADGQPGGWREIRLDPREPYQPLEIIDRSAAGDVQMHALLSNYQRIGSDGPFTARRYEVYWPQDHAEMRLDVTRAALRPDLREVVSDLFEFPAGWRGEVEQIDVQRPPAPGATNEDTD